MDWTTITNRDQEETARQILLHAEGLAEEINLRLWLEEWHDAGEEVMGERTMLFVESVTVDDIQYPARPGGPFRRLGRLLKRILKRIRRVFHRE